MGSRPYRALKLEVLILVEEDELTEAQVVEWTKKAMLDFCDFKEAVVKIKEAHTRILMDSDAEAIA
jgi:hypothetical protein